MANEEHLAILKKGVDAWNEWRKRNRGVPIDLRGADLKKANLRGVDFSKARLRGAKLQEVPLGGATHLMRADLRGANLGGADLRGAYFGAANLRKANLTQAKLKRASFFAARLQHVNLNGADMSGVDLVRAYFKDTEFRETDLSNCLMDRTVMVDIDLSLSKGLETVRHKGPSSIGIDTIYRSKGKIPELFLRGAGVPEEFITYMKSLVTNPIEFYSCFISYSTANQDFAERLYADLQNKNVRCWFAPHDVQGGKKLHEQIDEAIRVHEKVLLILSKSSMNSDWVKTEIAKARKREVREKKQVLFPVRLVPFEAIRDWECFDADAGKDSAREIREYFIPDFSEWEHHDKYKKAFERLLMDLKAGKTVSSE